MSALIDIFNPTGINGDSQGNIAFYAKFPGLVAYVKHVPESVYHGGFMSIYDSLYIFAYTAGNSQCDHRVTQGDIMYLNNLECLYIVYQEYFMSPGSEFHVESIWHHIT